MTNTTTESLTSIDLATAEDPSWAERAAERGAGVVEWLGISALSVALLVGLFASLTTVGEALIDNIRASLGL